MTKAPVFNIDDFIDLGYAYSERDIEKDWMIRLCITYGFGEIEVREGKVLDPNVAGNSWHDPKLRLHVRKAGGLWNGQIHWDGAYASKDRMADMSKRGVDRRKPYTRNFQYRTIRIVERQSGNKWDIVEPRG